MAAVPTAYVVEHLCERDLATEGPCYGPVFPKDQRAEAYRRAGGRWLCENHVAELFSADVQYGTDPTPKESYRVSRVGLHEGPPPKVGETVYVLFVPKRNRGMAEGMWVKVTAVKGNWITGTLDNEPLDPVALGVDIGDTVRFPRSAVRRSWKEPALYVE
jgi:hypothetical protein